MTRTISLLFAAVTCLAAMGAGAAPTAERTWKTKCASCHGLAGKGDTEMGKKNAIADYTTDAWQKGITDDKIKTAIREGVNRTNKDGVKQEMNAYGKDKIDDAMLDALVAHVRGLKK
jgi:cytochrome c6